MTARARREPWLRLRDNPILAAQARRRLRLRQALPGALVVAVLGFCGLLFAGLENQKDGWRALQTFAFGMSGILLYLRGTMRMAGVAAEERVGGLLDFHRATPTTAWTDTIGYLLGVPAREYLLAAITVPFLLLGTLLAGDAILPRLAAFAVLLLSGLVYHALALVAGLSMERRWSASGLAILIVLLLLGGWVPFAEAGLTAFAYLTPFPAIGELMGMSGDLGRAAADVIFFGIPLPATVFTILVQGWLLSFLVLAGVRRVRRDDAPVLSRTAALAFLGTGVVLLVGAAWGAPGDVFGMSVDVETAQVGTVYLLVAGIGATILQVTLAPTYLGFARAAHRARKAGRRAAPWLDDGATALLLAPLFTGVVLAGLVLLSATTPARAIRSLDLGVWPLLSIGTLLLFVLFAGGVAEWLQLRYRKAWRGMAFLVAFLTLVLPWLLGGILMATLPGDETLLWSAAFSPTYAAGYALTMTADAWSFGFARGGAPLGPYVLSLTVTTALAAAFHALAAIARRSATSSLGAPAAND